MLERGTLRTPITLGVVMIVLVVVLAAIWTVANFIAAKNPASLNFYVLLAIGIVLLSAVLAGVIAYLTLTVKAFNLNRRQSNFIDSVTHELKSPIASLKLYLQTMKRREVSDEERKDFHRFMLDDVERLDSLINHLLDVARVDRVVSESDVEPAARLRLDKLLHQCGSTVCAKYSVSDDTVAIESDEIEIVQSWVQSEILFRNLIDNAVKYGGSPPRVTVRAKRQNDLAVVSIEDNGVGIPVKQRRKVFSRFVRLGSELERSRPGTGLGLYLVRTIARSMNGSIHVSHCDDGSGSRFTVKIPV